MLALLTASKNRKRRGLVHPHKLSCYHVHQHTCQHFASHFPRHPYDVVIFRSVKCAQHSTLIVCSLETLLCAAEQQHIFFVVKSMEWLSYLVAESWNK